MSELLTYILFFIGFVLLIKGADFFVEGSASLARKLGIPSLIVGLTIVSIGTSFPELAVNVFSALKDKTDIALGNVIGSNISNILLILGIAAAIYPLQCKHSTVWKEIPFSLFATLVLFIMVNDVNINNTRDSDITRGDGILMFCFFLFFIYYVFEMGLKHKQETPYDAEDNGKDKIHPYWLIAIMMLVGLASLILGGKWVVDGAIAIARKLHMSEFLISVTIVAVGTSLPELVTSIIAALKKEHDISIGNIIGSNVFNILFILGITSIIKPVPVSLGLNNDIIFLMISTVFLFFFMFVGKPKYMLHRSEGIIMVALYIMYVIYVVIRKF